VATNLKGLPELKARIKSVRGMFKPYSAKWAEGTAKGYGPAVPVRPESMRAGDKHAPGRLARSFRVRKRLQTRAVVDGHYTAYFVNKGVVAHSMNKKAKGQDRTVFAKKHPGYRARPFLKRIAYNELRKTSGSDFIVRAWNEGA
jgi:hypothetical protein